MPRVETNTLKLTGGAVALLVSTLLALLWSAPLVVTALLDEPLLSAGPMVFVRLAFIGSAICGGQCAIRMSVLKRTPLLGEYVTLRVEARHLLGAVDPREMRAD